LMKMGTILFLTLKILVNERRQLLEFKVDSVNTSPPYVHKTTTKFSQLSPFITLYYHLSRQSTIRGLDEAVKIIFTIVCVSHKALGHGWDSVGQIIRPTYVGGNSYLGLPHQQMFWVVNWPVLSS